MREKIFLVESYSATNPLSSSSDMDSTFALALSSNITCPKSPNLPDLFATTGVSDPLIPWKVTGETDFMSYSRDGSPKIDLDAPVSSKTNFSPIVPSILRERVTT